MPTASVCAARSNGVTQGGGATLSAVPDPMGLLDAVARERLIEAARLAAVGRLIPSLAHQLATPLAAIALRAESLQGSCRGAQAGSEARLDRYLGAIATETGTCNELLGLIRDFARPPRGEREPVDLNEVCRGAARLVLHEAMQRQIQVGLELADTLPPLVAQEAVIRTAIVALILNAIDASSPAGRVTLATSAASGVIAVAVTDEGEGVSEDDRGRLFEPFFSTRPRGLGLGLVACRAAAEAHGGSVEIEARRRRGSRFILRLPQRAGETIRERGGDGV